MNEKYDLTKFIEALQQATSDKETAADFGNFSLFFDDWKDKWVVGSATGEDYFMYSMFVTRRAATRSDPNDLLSWNFCRPAGWDISYMPSKPSSIKAEPPFSDETGLLAKAEPLYCIRQFDGYTEDRRTYYDFNQKFIQTSNIHWVEHEQAFCDLDDVGSLRGKILVENHKAPSVVLVDRDTLDTYLVASSSILLRVFEFRHSTEDWSDMDPDTRRDRVLSSQASRFRVTEMTLRTRSNCTAVVWRGGQLVYPKASRKQVGQWVGCVPSKAKNHETFTFWDFRHKKIVTSSIDPKYFANYFVKSDKPFEMSPVFFKPEVLQKYKNNPDRYTLRHGQIYCRGAWSLQTFDTNEAGQVHTYVCYLQHLPYKEQLHWKQYNEEPKTGLSKRALTTDFKGEWWRQPEPLYQLKEELDKLEQYRTLDRLSLYDPKEGTLERTLTGLYYLVTDESKEWSDFNLKLAIATVDGLQIKTLATVAKKLGCFDKSKKKSLGLLKACVKAVANDDAIAQQIWEPLNELQRQRSKGAAHGGGSKPEGSLRTDASDRLKNIIEALRQLNTFLERKPF